MAPNNEATARWDTRWEVCGGSTSALGTLAPMKKLSTLASLAVGILMLSGCSQASTIAACGQVAAQAAQVTGVIGSVSSPTPEAAQAALDEVQKVAENIRGVDGPEEFVTLRDSWTTSIDAFAADGEKALSLIHI